LIASGIGEGKLLAPGDNGGSPGAPTSCQSSGGAMFEAVVAVTAVAALSALVARSAATALSALVARSAATALGTFPSFFRLMSERVRVRFFTFFPVTAFFFSCFVPTLFAGRWTAAYAPPPSATNTAIEAITFA
jgi:hypothetical protein